MESTMTEVVVVQTDENQQKLKAKRGTRRQQRYRAKQKRLLLELCEVANSQVVPAVVVINDDDDIKTNEKRENISKPPEVVETSRRVLKRKEELMTTTTTTMIPDHVVQSFSQLSIAPVSPCPPRQKKLRTAKSSRGKQQVSSVPPDYLNVPNRTFTSMFLTASVHVVTTSDQLTIIRRWLDNSSNMQYIRTQALLLDKLLYLQLQQSLWTHYFNVGTVGEDIDAAAEADDGGRSSSGVWASEVQEKMSRQSRNADSTTAVMSPLSFVINYRKDIDEQLEKAENELNQHTNSFEHLLRSRSSLIRTIDLSAILKAFVRRGQHKLNAEFQCKKRLLHFDYQDHCSAKAFFDLKPTKQQIQSAKQIWSATFKQQVAEEQVIMLKHRLFSKTLPKTFDGFDRSVKDLNKNLRSRVIDKDTRAMITSRRKKVIDQFKLDMMAIDISAAEATARGHAKRAREEKEKMMIAATLSALKDDAAAAAVRNEDEVATINNVINAIQARQENIIKRAQYVAASKMSFFDETPTLIN